MFIILSQQIVTLDKLVRQSLIESAIHFFYPKDRNIDQSLRNFTPEG